MQHNSSQQQATPSVISTSAKRIFEVEKTMLEVVEKLLIER
jgi:hypothetical protein